MILIQLRDFLKIHRIVNFFDITTRFKQDPEVLRDMLQLWINKGRVRKRQKTESCGSRCSKCHPFMTEVYEWVE